MDNANRSQPACVLLVDDDAGCRKLLETVLQMEGFTVLSAFDAERGLEILRARRVDAVVSDIKLPGMDGIGLLRHIRKHYGELPVILITGYGSIDSAVEALQFGAQDYLTKPIDDNRKLAVSLRNAIKHHRLTLQNVELQEELRRSEETFRQLFHNANDAIYLFVLGDDGEVQRFTEINNVACRKMEYSRGELLEMTILDLTSSEHRSEMQKSLLSLMASDSTALETFHTTKKGIKVPVEIKSRRFLLGGQTMIIARARDISMQRDIESRLTVAVENERRQLGQELHDLLCQDMASISMLASLIQNHPDAAVIGGLARKSVSFVRELCEGIFPVGIDTGGLSGELRRLVENQKSYADIACSFEERGNINIMEEAVAVNVYRIAQESVQNAVKHSGARNISVLLEEDGGNCSLTVEDDGTGITEESVSAPGLGLHIMRHRANIIGAVLKVEAVMGKGTRLVCSWREKG